jgi:hypothetical protein
MKKEVSCKRVRKWERRREKEGVRVKKGKEGERKKKFGKFDFWVCVVGDGKKEKGRNTTCSLHGRTWLNENKRGRRSYYHINVYQLRLIRMNQCIIVLLKGTQCSDLPMTVQKQP